MRRLNAREYYVLMIISIMAIIVSILLVRELYSETSPFVSSADGEFMKMRGSDVMNIIQTLLQLVLCITSFIFLIKIHRAGWIIAFALITFYAILISYVLVQGAIAGFIDPLFIAGVFAGVLILLAVIFLCIPSTLKKFNITKAAIVPVLCLWALMVTLYFIIP